MKITNILTSALHNPYLVIHTLEAECETDSYIRLICIFISMNDTVTFDIFEPEPTQLYFSRDVISLCFAVGIIVCGCFIDRGNGIFILFVIAWFVITMYFLFSSLVTRRPLRGKFEGEVAFNSNALIFKGTPYYLSDITAINFVFNDYYNKVIGSPTKSLNQRLSQGVNNYVEFTVKQKDTYIIYFRCETEDHHQLLDPFIKQCWRLNKLCLIT